MSKATNEAELNQLGANLSMLRRLRMMRQTEVAERLGVSTSWLSGLETGRTLPSMGLLARIAQMYDVPPSEVLEGVTPREILARVQSGSPRGVKR